MKKSIIILAALIFLAALAEKALAIPAFARKYRMSCTTCHMPFPRLKPYGDEFAGNGFKLADEEAPGYFVDTGDDDLNLLRNFPVAARLDGFVNYEGNAERADFGVPWGVKFLTGGEVTNNIAYYFYFYFDEQGEIAGVEDAYVMFNNLFGIDFDIYVGQFQVSDPLFKRELRLTLEDYNLYKAKPGLSKTNLTYDRGVMLTYGTNFGTSLVFEAVNGNGLAESDAAKIFDSDEGKMFMGRVSQDVGEFARVGGFVYAGSETLAGNSGDVTNNVLYWGPDVTLSYKEKLELNLQYFKRTDSDLYLTEETLYKDYETEGAMAELVYTPQGGLSKWYAAALFNWLETTDGMYDYRSAAAHGGYVLKRNLRLVGELRYDFSDCDNAFGIFSMGFILGV